jgi:hypothetical protein
MFSVWSVPGLYNEDYAVGRSEKLVAEVGDSSGTQRKGNVRCWKLLPSNGLRRLRRHCVCCSYSDVLSVELSESSTNPITNPNPEFLHTTANGTHSYRCTAPNHRRAQCHRATAN